MKKLIQGIIDFRETISVEYMNKFAALALGQSPDVLFIACSDSRVVPNLFASTDPGDLFVIRNVGNIVPCSETNKSTCCAEAAAIEFSIEVLKVRNIIICGHSDCGAMRAMSGNNQIPEHVDTWINSSRKSMNRLKEQPINSMPGEIHNQLSQVNVLQQIEHLLTYDVVRERVENGTLGIHGWWFDIATAQVFAYDSNHNQFETINEEYFEKVKSQL